MLFAVDFMLQFSANLSFMSLLFLKLHILRVC
jgi:hypothetical protein